jgi:hypothetical protein
MNEGLEADEEVLDDIVGAFGDSMWCRRDWARLPHELRLIGGWSDFKTRVTKSRYLFLLEDDPPDAIDLLMDPDALSPGQLLSELEEGLPALVTDWPTGRPLVRGRVHLSAEVVVNAASLGPPPPERATAQRMSPDGVAMFYGAEDAATAIAEVEVHGDAQRNMTTVGRFRPQRVLRVVDLTDLPGIPSIFDAEKRHQRPFLRFVSHFAEDIARPAPSTGATAMYVPTQIVTEYIRDHVRDADGNRIDGLVYWSSVRDGSRCVALFVGADACGDLESGAESGRASLLLLDRDSVRSRPRRRFPGTAPSATRE